MTDIPQDRSAPFHRHPLGILASRLAGHARRRRAYRQTYDELSALTDRDLKDVGLTRSDIVRVAAESAQNA